METSNKSIVTFYSKDKEKFGRLASDLFRYVYIDKNSSLFDFTANCIPEKDYVLVKTDDTILSISDIEYDDNLKSHTISIIVDSGSANINIALLQNIGLCYQVLYLFEQSGNEMTNDRFGLIFRTRYILDISIDYDELNEKPYHRNSQVRFNNYNDAMQFFIDEFKDIEFESYDSINTRIAKVKNKYCRNNMNSIKLIHVKIIS